MRIGITAQTPVSSANVLIDVDDTAPSETVASTLQQALGVDCRPLQLTPKLGVAPLEDDGTVATMGLRHGMRIGINGFSPDSPHVETTGLQLHIVSGPHSGLIFALPLGEHEIGRGAVISWPDDMLLSRRHARITVTEDSVTVADLGSSNGTFLDGKRLEPNEPAVVEEGSSVAIGTALLQVRTAATPDAAIENGDPGWLNFMRPPRIPDWHETPTVDVPTPPQEPSRRRFPIAALIAPLVMGVVMVLIMKNMRYALFMLLSPLMLIFNFISDKRTGAADYKKQLADYHEDLAKAQENLATAVKQEKARLRSQWPDAAETLLTCLLPGKRLWERRPSDPDALAIRVGTTDIASTVKVTGASDNTEHQLVDVPAGVNLNEQPIVGIAGPSESVDGIVRWVISQLAAYHPTRDLSCSFVGVGTGDDWQWLQWLPHMRPDPDEDGPVAYVFTEEKAAGDHLTGLAAMIQSRREAAGSNSSGKIRFPIHVLVIRDYRAVRLLPGLGSILSDGPAVGVYAICTGEEERMLPEECTATLVMSKDEPQYASLRRRGLAPVNRLLAEGVSIPWCDRLARELSPLIDVGADDQEGALPSASRLLDVLSLDPPTAQIIETHWQQEGRTTRAVIGEAIDGPFAIDIRKDGPHGLVAGTTGSGKSELLQTIVASLAVNNRPDEMNYVLIDYKGGAAFKDCANLPHTVGMVSDLDGHLTNRALESLSAELRRREHQLARAGAKDIEDYLAAKTDADEPMPRLLIIIDEFAALVQELPDFVAGLIDITRRGRSLGTHLILATQRPAGVVSAEIKSNTNLRIALRVTDAGDSSDVIDAPDSAYIAKSLPGRAYARLGHSSLIAFQSSRVGGRPPGTATETPSWAWAYTTTDLCSVPPTPQTSDEDSATIPTDLANLVEAIRQASIETGISSPPPPWLPPLDTAITIEDILKEFPNALPSSQNMALPIGMTDIPSKQSRGVSVYDIAHGSHLSVIGAGRTGKSTLLRAIAADVGMCLSPADVHLYGVDCGNNALLPLATLPHVGAIVTRDQAERLDRLTTMIRQTIAARQQQLASEGYADVTEQRAHAPEGSKLPYIVVLFDGWESFVQVYDNHDSGRLIAAWNQILQEGVSAGVRVIVTGDRTLLAGRTSALFPDKLMLKMPDPADFSAIGMSSRNVPDSFATGRGFRADGAVETQIALVTKDTTGTAQVAGLQQICRTAIERWADLPQTSKPKRVDILPVRFSISQLNELAPAQIPVTSIPVAVGGDTLGLRCLDAIEHGPALLVTGPRRSGRSTVLRTMATFARDKGWKIVILTPRLSPLRQFPTSENVYGPFNGEFDKEHLTTLLEQLRAQPIPTMVLVDDIELIGADGWLPDLLADHINKIRDTGSLFIGAGSPGDMWSLYRGPVAALKKSRSGVMLSPQSSTDADMFSVTLNRSALGQSLPPGAGFLVQGGAMQRVQVIWPDPD